MIKALLSNPWVILGVLAALAAYSGGVYIKGRSDGKQVERSVCNAEKTKAAEKHISIKKRQDRIRADYPDTRALLGRLRTGTYPQ